MSGRSPIIVAAIVMVAVVAAACGSNNASREAAGAVVLPDCAEGLTAECIVSVPGGGEPIVVSNGAVVTFADQGQPVTSLATSRICWSEEDDVDASTCVTNEAELPAWVSVRRMAQPRHAILRHKGQRRRGVRTAPSNRQCACRWGVGPEPSES